jgi:hypothetical protein
MNHAGGSHVVQRGQQRKIAVTGDVVVDFFRIDLAGVFQHHVHLLVKMLAQIALQLCYWLAAQASDYCIGVGSLDVLIQRLFWFHQHQRTSGAQSHAAGAAHEGLLARGLHRISQCIPELIGMLAQTAGAHAHVDLVIVLRIFLAN